MDGSISEDCSLGPESLTLGLPGEGASDVLQVLLNENRLLKENLAESSSAMQLACEKLASANDQFIRERQDFEEKCREAKEVVMALREEVRQKNDLIETMKLQAVEEVNYNKTGNESVKSRLAVLKKSVESATQERDELKNKCVALEMHLESEVANAEELRNQDRQTIESLQTTIETLQKVQAKERNEKQERSDSLDHLRGTFDSLLLEFEKLVNDEKIHKAALVTKDGQIQQLQLFVQHLERNCLVLQTQVEMCRSDFEGERNAHEFLNKQYVTLKATLEKLTRPRDAQRFSAASPSMNAGPSSMNSSPSPVNAGPSSMNAGPYTMNAGPYTMNAGPSSMNAGPSSMNAGRSFMNTGPSMNAGTSSPVNAGPYSMNAGPSFMNAGPSPVNAGRSSMNARPKNEVCICPKCGLKAQNIEALYLHSKTCTA